MERQCKCKNCFFCPIFRFDFANHHQRQRMREERKEREEEEREEKERERLERREREIEQRKAVMAN